MLFASAPPDTASPRVPCVPGSAFSGPGLPQGVLRSPRAGVSAWLPGHGCRASACWSARGARPGALGALWGPGRQGPMQSSFFQLSYCITSGPTTTQRDPFQIHQDRNPGAVPERSAGQQAPLPTEQVPHTYDHRVHPTEDRNSSSVTGFPWTLPSKPWLKFTVCKSEDTVLRSLAHVRSAAPSFSNVDEFAWD